MDETNGEQSECPYKNRLSGDDKDGKENTKLEEAVKEAEGSQESTQASAGSLAGQQSQTSCYPMLKAIAVKAMLVI